jgi:uncharacterized membrane protein YphA (DoxX/SURF4 family)
VFETIAGVGLGAVLVVAGVAKSVDPEWAAKAAELGAPRWTVRALPYTELILGALLVTGLVQPYPALATAVVLVAFTLFLLVRLAQGRRPPCACFGARSTKPIGPWSIVRNLVLIALAVVAAVA